MSPGDAPEGRPPPDRFARLCDIAELADPELSPARAAELYAQCGVAVFPVHPKSKVPLIRGGGGHYGASCDLVLVRRWWAQFPNAAVGVATGRYGHEEKTPKAGAAPRRSPGADIVVIDVDDPQANAEMMADLEQARARTVQTRRGFHFIFRYPEDLPEGVEIRSCTFRPGVDIKADGGYVLAPPHANRQLIRNAPPTPLPPWLRERLLDRARRNPPAASIAVVSGLRRDTSRVESLPPALWTRLEALEERLSDRSECMHAQVGVLQAEGYSLDAICAVLEGFSGLALQKYGDRLPQEVARSFAKHDQQRQKLLVECRELFDGDDEPPGHTGPSVLRYTHVHMATRFVATHKQSLRYTSGVGWFLWSGSQWQACDDDRARARVESFCAMEAEALEHQAGHAESNKEAFAIRRQAKALCSTHFITSVFKLACGRDDLRTSVDDWDQDRMLLNTPDGVVDLRTGIARANDPALLMTKQTRVSPGGACPAFLSFLNDFTGGDVALIDYIQRVMGMCLTGETNPHSLFFLWGPGGNGKSTFLDILEHVMGGYAGRISAERLMLGGEAHPEWMMRLRAQRMTIVPELPIGGRLNESLLKTLSGEPKITARAMHQGSTEITLQHKMVLVGNHMPSSRDMSQGMTRRLRMIPATSTVSPQMFDPKLLEKLKAEAPGILAFWIDGAGKFLSDPSAPADRSKLPRVVREATDEYFQTQDVIGAWLEDRCVRDLGSWVSYADLHGDFRRWAHERGELSFGALKTFTAALRDRGFQPHRRKQGRGVADLRLTFDDDGLPLNTFAGPVLSSDAM